MKNSSLSKSLLIYGLFLIFIGFVGFLSNPEKAKTALISGGLFGGLSLLWSYLYQKVNWAIYGALLTIIVVFVATTIRSFLSWKTVINGQSEKLVAASLITSMSLASFIMIITVFKNLKQKSS